MKETQFDIKDIKIYERVKAESGFTAQIKSAAGQSGKLTSLTIATDDEKGILDEFIPLAINECIVTINRYLTSCSVSKEEESSAPQYKIHHFNLVLPGNYPEENIVPIENIVMDFICNRCLQQWYMLVKSEDANTATIKAQSSMALLRDMLSMRTKPH
jgi:hypothetical protein